MLNSPTQQYAMEQKPSWHCLQALSSGKLIAEDVDEHGDPVGAVQVFWDAAEAEAAAVALRETYPGWLIAAVPLPAAPPHVTKIHPRDAGRVISIQTSLSLGDELLQIEVRPRTGDECRRLIHLFVNALKVVGTAEPSARMSPLKFIKVGHISKQTDKINKVA